MTAALLFLSTINVVHGQLDLPPLRDDRYDTNDVNRRQPQNVRYDISPNEGQRYSQDERYNDDREDNRRLQPTRDDRYGDRRHPDDDRYDRFEGRRPTQSPTPLRDNEGGGNDDRYGIGKRPNPNIELTNLLASMDFIGAQRCSSNVAAQWNYETNVNEVTQLHAVSFFFKSIITYRS